MEIETKGCPVGTEMTIEVVSQQPRQITRIRFTSHHLCRYLLLNDSLIIPLLCHLHVNQGEKKRTLLPYEYSAFIV